MNKCAIIILFGILCISCGRDHDGARGDLLSGSKPHALSGKAYKQWAKDEHASLQRKTRIGDFTYAMLYKPVDWIILQENGGKMPGWEEFGKKRSELEGLRYFDLRITNDESSGELLKIACDGPRQYDERVKYCAFTMQHDIKMLVDQDSVDCVLYHFERMFDAAPEGRFLLAFPEPRKDFQELTILFHDHLFSNGIIKFNYSRQELAAIPRINAAL